MRTGRRTWIEHYDKALGLWLSSPIIQHRVLTVFHVILPQTVLRTIAHKLDKVLYLSLASTLDQSVLKHALNLPLRLIINDFSKWWLSSAIRWVALQCKDVKYIMNAHGLRQVQLVGKSTNTFKHLEWFHPVGSKLVSTSNFKRRPEEESKTSSFTTTLQEYA